MSQPAPSPGLNVAIEAAADCVRLYKAALEGIDDPAWRQFIERMVLHRETLLHRLRFIGEERVELRQAEDLSGWRSWLGEISLSLKGLISDPIKTALTTIEPAETRLVEALGAIGVVTADPDELIEIVEGVTAERDVVRSLLDDLDVEGTDAMAAPDRPA